MSNDTATLEEVSVSVRLPEPPSANRWWRKWHNRMVLSAEARAYESAIALLMGGAIRPIGTDRHWPLFPHPQPVALEIVWFRCRRAGDLDKRLGVLLDALQGTLYGKDAQIVEIHARRREAPGMGEGWVELRAWAAGETQS